MLLTAIIRHRHVVAYSALGVIIISLLSINSLRGLEIRECNAERAAVAALTEQMRQQAAEAVKRLEQEQARRKRMTDRTMRDINNAPDNRAISGPLRSAIDGLCSMGAACPIAD